MCAVFRTVYLSVELKYALEHVRRDAHALVDHANDNFILLRVRSYADRRAGGGVLRSIVKQVGEGMCQMRRIRRQIQFRGREFNLQLMLFALKLRSRIGEGELHD